MNLDSSVWAKREEFLVGDTPIGPESPSPAKKHGKLVMKVGCRDFSMFTRMCRTIFERRFW